jgi:hypothetical protein
MVNPEGFLLAHTEQRLEELGIELIQFILFRFLVEPSDIRG